MLCQAALGSLAVEAWEVMSRLLHYSYNAVEVHAVLSVGEDGKRSRVDGTSCCNGITLDAWYLHKTTHRVTRKSQMMLQRHLGGILNL